MWDDVKALRKEYKLSYMIITLVTDAYDVRYRQRESGVVKTVLGDSQVCNQVDFEVDGEVSGVYFTKVRIHRTHKRRIL